MNSKSINRRSLIATAIAGTSLAAMAKSEAQIAGADNPELDKIRKLLADHDKAMTAHDLGGVLGAFTDTAFVMGTGPGEMWSGPDELKDAYAHFFEVFDKGAQDFKYNYRQGGLSDEMGWLMTSGTVSGKSEGKEFAYPLNVSLTVEKTGESWKIAAMHFSTLTSGE